MASDLGAQVLLAMTDQGWPWTITATGDWAFWSPVVRGGRVLDARIVTDTDWEPVLRDLLVILIVRYHLDWDTDPRGGFGPYN